jgi:hypothetical protein
MLRLGEESLDILIDIILNRSCDYMLHYQQMVYGLWFHM